ncbi:MAG: MoaD/ThiS family protein [Gemmatimonadaceae bacterium]
MTVTVRLFASYAERLGQSSLSIDLPAGARVRDAVTSLRSMPGGSMLPQSPLVAINRGYASPDSALSEGDELAVIPPVAGG